MEMKNIPPRKPWLSVIQQVECLKDKGVTFNKISEREAVAYLEKNNNYFRLGSYRKTFPRYSVEGGLGNYISLDFATLVDLSIIDMLLRQQILPMALDIEHFEKMQLLRRIENEGEDGYLIVADFLRCYDSRWENGQIVNRIKSDISRGSNSPYVSDLITYYPDFSFPAWSFMEVIAFGTFIEFYKFCANRFDDKQMNRNYYLLQKIKSIRNACAHNNCILNNLTAGTAHYNTPNVLYVAVGSVKTIGKSARKSRLSNDRLVEITATLYKHEALASDGIHKHRAEQLQIFKNRMMKHPEYYMQNLTIASSFDYLAKLIDAWYGC